MTASATSWKNTALWNALVQCSGSGAEPVRAALSSHKFMDTIEAWLKHASPDGTGDFTLHDDEHGFRVAQRMVEVMPSSVLSKLSAYELGLLLMSAYLHDIGMTPRRGLVRELWNYLAFGIKPTETISTLPPVLRNELLEFRRYLDDNGVEPGLLSKRQDVSTRGTVDELVAYYCRRRHNDWSKAWVDEYLSGHQFGDFQSWTDDLIDLCLSHHYGKERLVSERFDPRLVSNAGEMVNLRYLACVLRIADILENDPKRTPEIVFQQRDVQLSSRIYWFKDHEFRCQIKPTESGGSRKLIVSARPKRAAMERACRETMEAIAAELRLCRNIQEEKPFNHARGQKCDQYAWDILDLVTDDIRNLSGAYVYIDGAFRPDTKRVLQLLSGNALYGDSLAAVRELLQNAFDAVREVAAHERLSIWDSLRPEEQRVYDWASHKDAYHSVVLRFESEADPNGLRSYWLTCTDDGVGMSRAILEKYLLVSGAAARTELRDLERRCETAGFSLGRTGQFGIGVLSYFMIADRVEVWTRRDPRSGGDDGTGWYFETEGVGAFGELRKAPGAQLGTKVRLRLREDQFEGNVQIWLEKLGKYLRRTLIKVPCRFRFDGTCEGGEAFAFERGWTLNVNDCFDVLVSAERPGVAKFGTSDGERVVTPSMESARHDEELVWSQVREEMRAAIRWKEVSGDLPNHSGQFRVNIAYFDLLDGLSLAFLRLVRREDKLLCLSVLSGVFSARACHERLSWKGMRTGSNQITGNNIVRKFGVRGADRAEFFGAHMVVVERDITSSKVGAISINRNSVGMSSGSLDIDEPVREAVARALRELADQIAIGKHLLVSQSCIEFDLNARSGDLYWPWSPRSYLMRVGDGVCEMKRLSGEFGFADERLVAELEESVLPRVNSKKSSNVTRFGSIFPFGQNYAHNAIKPSIYLVECDSLARCVDGQSLFGTFALKVFVLRTVNANPSVSEDVRRECGFPPSWGTVVCAVVDELCLLNYDNLVVKAADKKRLAHLLRLSGAELYGMKNNASEHILHQSGWAAAWLVACCALSGNKLDNSPWRAIQSSASGLLDEAWKLALGVRGNSKLPLLRVLSQSGGHLEMYDMGVSFFGSVNTAVGENVGFFEIDPEWTVFFPSKGKWKKGVLDGVDELVEAVSFPDGAPNGAKDASGKRRKSVAALKDQKKVSSGPKKKMRKLPKSKRKS